MSEEHEELGLPELHSEVVDLDAKLLEALQDDHTDKETADALIEQRNEAYKRNHSLAPQPAAEAE